MKVGIFYRADNELSCRLIKDFSALLKKNNIDFCLLNEAEVDENHFESLDLIVVFGGDGTVLSATKYALDKIPLVAINAGNVGFLTTFEGNELEKVVLGIINNSFKFTERRLLLIDVGQNSYYALNDAVILKDFKKDDYSCCIKLDLFLDHKNVDKYLADGMIVSTATGSTAYALSAGAPIVTPDLDALVVAPICPHSLHSRPIVFSPKSLCEVQVNMQSRPCALYIDGSRVQGLEKGQTVKIVLSDKKVRICDNCNNFFEKLSKKISSWSNNI